MPTVRIAPLSSNTTTAAAANAPNQPGTGVSRLREDFAQFGVWAGVVYAGLYAAVSLAPLPAAVFTLGAGALFGVTEGLVVVEAGATVGAVIGFWLARVLGRDLVARVSGASVEKLDERFTGRGVLAVLAVRLLQCCPSPR